MKRNFKLLIFALTASLQVIQADTLQESNRKIIEENRITCKETAKSAGEAILTGILLIIARHESPLKNDTNAISPIALGIAIAACATIGLTADSLAADYSEVTWPSSDADIIAINKKLKKKEVLLNGGAIIALIAASVFCVNELYPIAQDIFSYFFPTEEQKAAALAATLKARQKIALFEAKDAFRDCLMKCLSSKSAVETNAAGCPTICEEAGSMLALIAGNNFELDKITEAFEVCKKQ